MILVTIQKTSSLVEEVSLIKFQYISIALLSVLGMTVSLSCIAMDFEVKRSQEEKFLVTPYGNRVSHLM
jgi:hypothetical protein